jgi:hypothetical protein
MKTFLHLLIKIKYLILLLAQMLLMKSVVAQPRTLIKNLPVQESAFSFRCFNNQPEAQSGSDTRFHFWNNSQAD